MALPRVEVSIGITLNVGNYESVRAEARFGEDVEGTTSASWQGCIAEAKEGLKAALDGVEKMLAARKQPEVKKQYPPPVSAGGPRRAGR